jgi:hypothetical protein
MKQRPIYYSDSPNALMQSLLDHGDDTDTVAS